MKPSLLDEMAPSQLWVRNELILKKSHTSITLFNREDLSLRWSLDVEFLDHEYKPMFLQEKVVVTHATGIQAFCPYSGIKSWQLEGGYFPMEQCVPSSNGAYTIRISDQFEVVEFSPHFRKVIMQYPFEPKNSYHFCKPLIQGDLLIYLTKCETTDAYEVRVMNFKTGKHLWKEWLPPGETPENIDLKTNAAFLGIGADNWWTFHHLQTGEYLDELVLPFHFSIHLMEDLMVYFSGEGFLLHSLLHPTGGNLPQLDAQGLGLFKPFNTPTHCLLATTEQAWVLDKEKAQIVQHWRPESRLQGPPVIHDQKIYAPIAGGKFWRVHVA